jgi:murein DD-endopeptidase MepM/ murein hydrolase activator NlpD
MNTLAILRAIALLGAACIVAGPSTEASELQFALAINDPGAIEQTSPAGHLLVAAQESPESSSTRVPGASSDQCEAEGRRRYETCMTRTSDDREACLRLHGDTVNTCTYKGAPPKGKQSQNIYRIPYADGTNVHISRDFEDHNPPGRIDMHGRGGGTHRIVAAADGTIRHIQDGRSKQQHPESWLRNAACFNNYVWIEHANGEWSKYSHMEMGTTSAKAGRKVGDTVAQGDYLGDEGTSDAPGPPIFISTSCRWEIVRIHPSIKQAENSKETTGIRASRTSPAMCSRSRTGRTTLQEASPAAEKIPSAPQGTSAMQGLTLRPTGACP